MNEEQHEQFRSQVEHLVAAGKLTAEEAAELLDGLAGDEPGEPLNLAPLTAATDTPPDLHLDVTGYALHVVQDSAAPHPQLHVSEPGRVELTATPQGWQVREVKDTARRGILIWSGQLAAGEHQLKLHGGNARLALRPDSSLRVDARVTGGLFAADFATRKSGEFGSARYQGQIGDGAALLTCEVAGGQIRLGTA